MPAVAALSCSSATLSHFNVLLSHVLRVGWADMRDDVTALNDPQRLEARYKADEFLRSLVEGTVASTGSDFLRELVKHVAAALENSLCVRGVSAAGISYPHARLLEGRRLHGSARIQSGRHALHEGHRGRNLPLRARRSKALSPRPRPRHARCVQLSRRPTQRSQSARSLAIWLRWM